MKKQPIIIIGAGLTGLATAWLLKKQGINALVLEARESVGGRIETITGANGTPIEMGATWFGGKHQFLVNLLKELQIAAFPQFQQGKGLFESMSFTPAQEFDMPQGEEPSYRIAGGTQTVIQTLKESLNAEQIITGAKVHTIVQQTRGLQVFTQDTQYLAEQVISTLPPKLLVETVEFSPALPESIANLCANTHTWMGESIKFAVEYSTPFWRERGFSGAIFSQVGIANEVHDHTNLEENTFALKGFLSGGSRQMTKAQREAEVLKQLERLFGKVALEYTGYYEKVWANEPFTTDRVNEYLLPHQNNGHPVFQNALLDDRFVIAGTETSPVFGGYMDGAVHSAHLVVERLAEKLKVKGEV
ncbi:MAG TPA: amine oxidase [Microscillaceae bacterium]|nr:amine oxidase [Microscillaceae bacterium]